MITRDKALSALDDAFKDKLSQQLAVMVSAMAVGDSMRLVSDRFAGNFAKLLDAHNAAEQVIKAAIPGDKTETHP